MKKILLSTAVIAATFFTACIKDNSVKPTIVKTIKLAYDDNINDFAQGDIHRNDLGQGDVAGSY